jgi:hypothetical protein
VSQVLVLLTCGATLDVFRDPCPGTWPEVFPVDGSDCFVSSRMAVDGSFMPYVHQLPFQTLIWWNNESLTFDISPKWFVWVVNAFNRVDTCPFFH